MTILHGVMCGTAQHGHIPSGHYIKTSSGGATLTVPAGVFKMTAVLIGGGGGCSGVSRDGTTVGYQSGGGGGGLVTVDFTVEPGDSLYVYVGGGGSGGSTYNTYGYSGSRTYLKINDSYLIQARGGGGGDSRAITSSNYTYTSGSGGSGGTYATYGHPNVVAFNANTGGSGGAAYYGPSYSGDTTPAKMAGGGGGAAGYAGNGGAGGRSTRLTEASVLPSSGSGAAAGGMVSIPNGYGDSRSGGGVGLYGLGDTASQHGGGGSSGTNAGVSGGWYGGGGGPLYTTSGQRGGGGACRIVWNTNASFVNNVDVGPEWDL